MKLSQIEKRIPQTLTNSKDIIQTDREYARRSSRARSTRCQENEAWALYKKNQFRESWGDLSGHRYIICPKPPYPAEKILDGRQLFFLAVPPGIRSPQRGIKNPYIRSTYHVYGKPENSGENSNGTVHTFRGITFYPFLPKRPKFSYPCLDYQCQASCRKKVKSLPLFCKWNPVPVFGPKKIPVPFDGNFSPKFPYKYMVSAHGLWGDAKQLRGLLIR